LEARLTIVPPTFPDQYVVGDPSYEVKEQRRSRGHKETFDLTTTITWETPYATLKSLTGAQYHYLDFNYEADATSRSAFHFDGRRDRSISVSQEVNLSDTLDGPFGTRLDWLLGAYYLDDQYRTFIPVDINAAAAGLGLLIAGAGDQVDRAYAGFGDATLWLLPWLRVFGGIRQSYEDKELFQNFLAYVGPENIEVPPIPPAIQDLAQLSLCRDVTLKTSFDNLSPRYGLQVDAMDGLMLYAQRSLGFKAGGANPFACDNVYAPEDVDSKEVGFKSTWLDGNVTANFAYFSNDFENFQVLKSQGFEAPVVNAKGASIDGAELELRAAPFAGFSNALAPFVLSFAGSLLNARYDEFRDTDPANPDVGVQDLEDHHLNRAPDYTANVGLEYEWQVPAARFGPLRLRGEWYKTDDVWYRPYGGPDDIQESFSLWNAYASLADASGRLELRLIGKNLADQGYYSMITAIQIGNRYAQPGAPRSITGEIVLRF
ncbi:MAG: TonB-dependent receptor, partial [Candidatus Binatia bacterium]